MKSRLRKEYLKKRRGSDKEVLLDKSKAIKSRFLSMQEYIDAKTILFYVSFENEVDTVSLIEEALLQKRVYVPKVRDGLIIVSELLDFNDLEKNKVGIYEPKEEFLRLSDVKDIDVIVVPGIVFDRKGYRIGFGKGNYDKLLYQTNAVKIGFAYDFQVRDGIPHMDHDIVCDIIVTENEIIRCK